MSVQAEAGGGALPEEAVLKDSWLQRVFVSPAKM